MVNENKTTIYCCQINSLVIVKTNNIVSLEIKCRITLVNKLLGLRTLTKRTSDASALADFERKVLQKIYKNLIS